MSYGLKKQQNPEIAALEAQWWKDWWAQDFSWDGLKGKSTTSATNILGKDVTLNLQDYWRSEDSVLISEPGTSRRWTRLHCPFVFADGSASPKAQWSHDDWKILLDDISKKAEANQSFLLLTGGVINLELREPKPWETTLADHAYFAEALILGDNCQYEISSAWIAGDLITQTNLAIAKLKNSFTADDKDFIDSISTNLSKLNLTRTTCVGKTNLSGVKFTQEARFCEMRFLGVADFTRAQFLSTQYPVDFSGARFSDKAEFSEIRFAHEAIFNGAKFAGRTNFYATTFEDRALFDDVECLENIHFYKAAFVRRLTINRAIFYRKFNMEGITDGDPLALSSQPLELSATEIDGKITGLSGEIKPSVGPTTQSYHVLPKLIAEGAVFHYDANFSNRDIISPSTFENARFYHWARFHGSVLHPNVSLHNTRFDAALGFRPTKIVTPTESLLRLRFMSLPEERDFNAWKKTFLKARLETHKSEFTYNGFYDALEASYRTLKQTMEDRRDRIREGQFFMYELRARRKRHDVPLWETAASWLYWGASDYGNSIFRPLILMGLMFAGLALVYFGMAEKAFYTGALTFPLNPDASDRLTQAFSFSLNNTFSPFSALDASKIADKDEWTSQLLLSNDAGFGLKIKVLATLQSLLTLTLAFLAGLAGRRRFQIN